MSNYKKLQEHHKEMARMVVAGYKNNEIATQLGVSHGSVLSVKNSPLFKAYVDNLQDSANSHTVKVRKIIAEQSVVAVEAIADLLDPNSEAPPSVVLGAAKDILDRAGHAPQQITTHNHRHITANDILKLRERAQAAGAQFVPEEILMGAT